MYLMMLLAILQVPRVGGPVPAPWLEINWGLEVVYILVGQVLQGILWWGAFAKARQPGWAGFIPVYREIIMCQMTDKPVWWAVFSVFCPCVWLVMYILILIEMANRFGQGGGFAVGLILLGIVFIPILSYGSSQYMGGRRGRRRPRDDDDDEDDDDRPRRRRPRDEDEDEDDDDRPRKKPRARDDDDEDDDEDRRRIKRRPRDDD